MPVEKQRQPGRQARRMVGCFILALAASGAFPASSAWGHKLIVFATVQGQTIQGEVYHQDGSPVRSTAVSILGPVGETLGAATTDAEGKFAYQPQVRCAHRFVVNEGLGHSAEYTVPVDELPPDLPARGAGESGATAPSATAAAAENPAEPASGLPGSARAEVAAELRALNQQIAALRADLEKGKAALRLQDMLGGVGYILGILGLLSYVFAGRRREKASRGGP